MPSQFSMKSQLFSRIKENSYFHRNSKDTPLIIISIGNHTTPEKWPIPIFHTLAFKSRKDESNDFGATIVLTNFGSYMHPEFRSVWHRTVPPSNIYDAR